MNQESCISLYTWKQDNEQDDQDDQDEDEENAIPEYKQLIAIHAGKPKGGLDIWHIDPIKVRRLSLSEQELENATRTRGSDIVRWHYTGFHVNYS